jgi:hypothetical protein
MIRLLDEVNESGFQSAAFLTYGVDLTFFESKVMSRLQEMRCHNVIVVADGHQSKDALNSAAQLRYVGVQCPLVSVRLGNRAFHPKALLLVGEQKLKVLVGSGNLTVPGYTRNWELFTKLEGEEAAGLALELLGVFEAAAALSPLKEAFAAWRERLEKSNPWLFGEEVEGRPVRLLSSSEAPILPRVKELLEGRKVEELVVASPFFDADGSALRWLIDNFEPERLTLLVDDGAQLDPIRLGEVLEALGDAASVRRFLRDGRPLHGKLLLLRGDWGEALLTGSPNLSSAALLSRAGRSRGNFEVAVFRSSPNGNFSALIEDRIGGPTNLEQIRSRRPYLPEPKVSPLELEAVWVSGGVLFALPAEDLQKSEHDDIKLLVERGVSQRTTHRLHRQVNQQAFYKELTDEDRINMEGGPSRARLLTASGGSGPPVWVQNLDAVEKRANPVQRPRYSEGLQALNQGSLGPYWESWNVLFEAFSTFSNSWLRYAATGRPKTAKPTARPESSQQDWDPGLFYISRDEVTLELPRYFAKVENSGAAIGDFEYLISALPSARRASTDDSGYGAESTDALVGEEEAEGEEGDDEEAAATEEEEPSPEITEEHLEWLRKRLYKKFRTIIDEYEGALFKAPVADKAEANYLCLPYPALQKAIMVSAREGLLYVGQFRELASRLTAAWTTELWRDAPKKEELEETLACAATSLVTIGVLTSPWLRELAGANEFDHDLYKQLREPLRELRQVFLSLKETYEVGGESREWETLVNEYNRLRHAELDEEYFAAWTPLQVLDDLARRYKVWELDEMAPWQRAVDRLRIEGSVQRDGDVLRVRAKLPHVGVQTEFLRRLLYSVRGGVGGDAAVVWDNDEPEGNVRRTAMVLCFDQKAALEISFFSRKRPLVRSYRVTGGTSSEGVYLTGARFLTYIWRQGLIHPVDAAQTTLFRCAAELAPDLPVAEASDGDGD